MVIGRRLAGAVCAPEINEEKDNPRMTAMDTTNGRSFIPMTLGHRKMRFEKNCRSVAQKERSMWARAPSLVRHNHETRRNSCPRLSGGAKRRFFASRKKCRALLDWTDADICPCVVGRPAMTTECSYAITGALLTPAVPNTRR